MVPEMKSDGEVGEGTGGWEEGDETRLFADEKLSIACIEKNDSTLFDCLLDV